MYPRLHGTVRMRVLLSVRDLCPGGFLRFVVTPSMLRRAIIIAGYNSVIHQFGG